MKSERISREDLDAHAEAVQAAQVIEQMLEFLSERQRRAVMMYLDYKFGEGSRQWVH